MKLFPTTGLFKNTHELYESFFPLIPTVTSLGSLSPLIRILTGFVANYLELPPTFAFMNPMLFSSLAINSQIAFLLTTVLSVKGTILGN